jgi:hypothetical protein
LKGIEVIQGDALIKLICMGKGEACRMLQKRELTLKVCWRRMIEVEVVSVIISVRLATKFCPLLHLRKEFMHVFYPAIPIPFNEL